jgi:hypothetical protein
MILTDWGGQALVNGSPNFVVHVDDLGEIDPSSTQCRQSGFGIGALDRNQFDPRIDFQRGQLVHLEDDVFDHQYGDKVHIHICLLTYFEKCLLSYLGQAVH